MFSLHQSDELLLMTSSLTTNQQNTIKSNTVMDNAALDGSKNNKLKSTMEESRRQRKTSLSTPGKNYEMNPNNHHNMDKKKKIHKEIERQRRQEMSDLYSSLRSQLPLEYIKGKRSISDHMNEAVNYINHLQTKIKELGVQRDELRKLSISSGSSDPRNSGSTHNNKNLSFNRVMVYPCKLGGVEIVISNDFKDEGLTLSGVLKIFLGEGLSVVSCVSAKVNGRLLHTIQIEAAGDSTTIDLSGLQRKLTDAIMPLR